MTEYNVQFPSLGLDFHINPVAITISNFSIYWYGIIIGSGFLLALLFALKNLKRFGINRDKFFDCVLVGLVCGIIGARAYYVIFRWNYYMQNTSEIFSIHNGGLAIYGGVIGGLLGGCIVAKIHKISVPAILDVGVMGFLIGQGIGRWGNFINQEAFGIQTSLPWGMLSENTNGVTVHPCFLYESIWCLLGFFVLNHFSKKHRKYDGQIFLLYLVWYGFERMIVEGLRTDSLMTPIFNLRVSQVLAGLTMVLGIILLFVFRNRTFKAADTYKGSKHKSSGKNKKFGGIFSHKKKHSKLLPSGKSHKSKASHSSKNSKPKNKPSKSPTGSSFSPDNKNNSAKTNTDTSKENINSQIDSIKNKIYSNPDFTQTQNDSKLNAEPKTNESVNPQNMTSENTSFQNSNSENVENADVIWSGDTKTPQQSDDTQTENKN